MITIIHHVDIPDGNSYSHSKAIPFNSLVLLLQKLKAARLTPGFAVTISPKGEPGSENYKEFYHAAKEAGLNLPL